MWLGVTAITILLREGPEGLSFDVAGSAQTATVLEQRHQAALLEALRRALPLHERSGQAAEDTAHLIARIQAAVLAADRN